MLAQHRVATQVPVAGQETVGLSAVVLCAVVFAYPLEFSKLLFAADGNTAMDLLKIFAFLLLAMRALTVHRAVMSLPMIWQVAFAYLFLLVACSWLYSFSLAASLVETMRLATWFCLMAITCQVAQQRSAVQAWVSAVRWTALAHGLLIIFEAATDWHIWEYTEDIDFEELTRYHGTFSDSNISARFLSVGLLLWMLPVQGRGDALVLRLAPALTLLAAIVLTGSRSGIVGVAAALLLVAATSNWRIALAVVVILAASVGVVFQFMQAGVEADALTRLATLADPAEAFNERFPLMIAAVTMFGDNPIAGIGWGAFEATYISQYGYLIGEKDLTKSHTAVLTMAAELGALGIIAMGLIMWLVAREAFGKAYRFSKPLSVALVAAIFVTFLSAQSEGRFWEDAMFWMLLGVLLANADPRKSNLRGAASHCAGG